MTLKKSEVFDHRYESGLAVAPGGCNCWCWCCCTGNVFSAEQQIAAVE